MGGHAGSEEDSSEEESEDVRGHIYKEDNSRKALQAASLEAETSALDRPPKAPAMLNQPNDEHEILQVSFYFANFILFSFILERILFF